MILCVSEATMADMLMTTVYHQAGTVDVSSSLVYFIDLAVDWSGFKFREHKHGFTHGYTSICIL